MGSIFLTLKKEKSLPSKNKMVLILGSFCRTENDSFALSREGVHPHLDLEKLFIVLNLFNTFADAIWAFSSVFFEVAEYELISERKENPFSFLSIRKRKLQNVKRPARIRTHQEPTTNQPESPKNRPETISIRVVGAYHLPFSCEFELQYICARSFVMVAHVDRLMQIVTNENGVLRKWTLSTSLVTVR